MKKNVEAVRRYFAGNRPSERIDLTNPARDVPKLKPKRKGGFPRWKPADLDKFETCYPIGSKARLALALLMFTGARR
jgi:hypothetical protein